MKLQLRHVAAVVGVLAFCVLLSPTVMLYVPAQFLDVLAQVVESPVHGSVFSSHLRIVRSHRWCFSEGSRGRSSPQLSARSMPIEFLRGRLACRMAMVTTLWCEFLTARQRLSSGTLKESWHEHHK